MGEDKKVENPEKCESCDGVGIRIMFNTDRDHLEIQRCDNCQVFKGDKEAWEYLNPFPDKFVVKKVV